MSEQLTTILKQVRIVVGSSHKFTMYEQHVLLGLNQVYYWVYKCTTCHHYTNIIKTV